MAHAVRPPLRQTKLSFSPAPHSDDVLGSTPKASNNVSTRRTSKSGPLVALGDDDRAVKQLVDTPVPAPVARTASRKRSATALADATTPDTRPPTKITVTQPHGELLRITNGVLAPLGIHADDVPSGRSTPRPGSAGKLAPAQDKRSLRSHDGGSRLKSDLATYFASYDDIIAGVPKPAEFLDYDTPIYVVDEPTRSKTPVPVSPQAARASLSPTRPRKRKLSPPPSPSCHNIPPAQSSTAFQVLDYAAVSRHVRHDQTEDPLADSVFFAQHRRAERKEKQLRNIEKERAMHEKVQLERLLDGLQGPDWLKVMGITGVTDGERKDWEPKRDFFVKEVEALVDKFRVWKDEEKRLRTEREAALHAHDDEEEDETSEESEAPSTIAANGPSRLSDQHLKQAKPPAPKKPPRPHGFLLPLIPPEPAGPFQSFYSKPHLRAAALGKQRHGRNATAFGLPIPDFEEHEFEMPEEFIDPHFIRDNARQRRRRKRESGTNPSSSSSVQ